MFLLKIFWDVSTARINQRSSQPLDNFFGPARCCQTVGFVFCLGLLNPCLGLPWGLVVKNPPAKAGDLGSIPGLEDPLEKRMATHSSFLAWRIPWTKEPGRLQSMRSQRVGQSDQAETKKPLPYNNSVPAHPTPQCFHNIAVKEREKNVSLKKKKEKVTHQSCWMQWSKAASCHPRFFPSPQSFASRGLVILLNISWNRVTIFWGGFLFLITCFLHFWGYSN